jgi:hypothetical protein
MWTRLRNVLRSRSPRPPHTDEAAFPVLSELIRSACAERGAGVWVVVVGESSTIYDLTPAVAGLGVKERS